MHIFIHFLLTLLLWCLAPLGQPGRSRNEAQTAEQRAENTNWIKQVTIRGTQRIRVVLWGGGRRKEKELAAAATGWTGNSSEDSQPLIFDSLIRRLQSGDTAESLRALERERV